MTKFGLNALVFLFHILEKEMIKEIIQSPKKSIEHANINWIYTVQINQNSSLYVHIANYEHQTILIATLMLKTLSFPLLKK